MKADKKIKKEKNKVVVRKPRKPRKSKTLAVSKKMKAHAESRTEEPKTVRQVEKSIGNITYDLDLQVKADGGFLRTGRNMSCPAIDSVVPSKEAFIKEITESIEQWMTGSMEKSIQRKGLMRFDSEFPLEMVERHLLSNYNRKFHFKLSCEFFEIPQETKK